MVGMGAFKPMTPILLVHDRSLFPSPRASSVSRSARISTTRLCRGNTVLSNRVSARHAVLHLLIYPSTLCMAGMVSSSPPPVTNAEKDRVAKWMPSVLTHSRLHTIARRANPCHTGFARQAFEARRTSSSAPRHGQIMPPAKSAYNPRSSGTDRSSCPHCSSRPHSDRLTADHGSVRAGSSDNSGKHTTHHVR
jgi:hypothetical protein